MDGRSVERGARQISSSFKVRLRVAVVKEGLSRVAVAWDPAKEEEEARDEEIVDEVENATDALGYWPVEAERAADNV